MNAPLKKLLLETKAGLRRRVKAVYPRYQKLRHTLVSSHLQLRNPAGRAPTVFWDRTFNYVAQHPTGNQARLVIPADRTDKESPARLSRHAEFFERHRRGEDPDLWVYELEDLRVWGSLHPAFTTPRNEFLLDLSFDPWGNRLHPYLGRFRLPKMQRVEGRSVVLAAVNSESNYYHFTVDLLPQLRLLEKAGYDLATIDHFIMRPLRGAYQKEMLTLAGVDLAKVIEMDESHHYSLAHAIVPQALVAINHLASWKLEYLRGLNRAPASPPQRRLFVGRRSAQLRRLVNEDELARRLEQDGYEVIDLHGMKVAAQMQLFSEAKEIVAVHGAALTNLIYCPPGIRVFEICNSQHPTTCYWAIADALKFHYEIYYGNTAMTLRSEEPHRIHNQDFVVNLEELMAFLGSFSHAV